MAGQLGTMRSIINQLVLRMSAVISRMVAASSTTMMSGLYKLRKTITVR